jgi:Outer membrane protein
MKTLLFSTLALAALAVAGSASAQDIPTGPAIPGVCIYNHEGLMVRSTAGQSLQAGMQRIQGEVQAELLPYEQFIQTEGTALQQGAATIPQEERQQRGQALNVRVREYQQLVQTRETELRYTQAVQARTIAEAAEPIVAAQYGARGCGILFAREATVLHANPSMDITDAVIQQLNTTLPSLSFTRMTPPADAAQ